MKDKYSKTLTFAVGGLLVIIFLSLILFIHNASLNSSNQNVIRIHFADNISRAHESIIENFNKENKGKIEVVPINLPFTKFSTNERKEILTRSLRSKSDLIDIFSVDVIWVPRFAKWAENMDAYFTEKERQQILKNALVSCYYMNHLMAIPLYTDIGMMYYRRDILESFPNHSELTEILRKSITWEEFINLGKSNGKLKSPFFIFPARNYEGLVCSFVELMASQGASIDAENGIDLNTPESEKSLQLLVDFVNDYGMTPKEVLNYDEYQCYLYSVEKDALFIRGWPGFLIQYDSIFEGNQKRHLFEKAAIPHFKNGKTVSVIGGWNLMISKYSQKKREAIKFIKFLVKKENQKLLYLSSGYIPVNVSIYSDSSFTKKHRDLVFYEKLLRRGVHRPFLHDYTRISDIISYYIHSAIKREISPREALDMATKLINENKFLIK
jgi:multiple sugar transport system substrate-binding protein